MHARCVDDLLTKGDFARCSCLSARQLHLYGARLLASEKRSVEVRGGDIVEVYPRFVAGGDS